MGHHLLPGLPRTPAFKRVVALLGDSAGAPGTAGMSPGTLEEIAEATVVASDNGFERAKGDEGLSYCLYLMAALASEARQPDFAAALSSVGLPPPPAGTPDAAALSTEGQPPYTVFDLVSGFSEAVDRHLRNTRSRTDIGEMAQLAASESLSFLCGRSAETLWGTTQETVQQSLRQLSTEKGFSTLAHDFFARLSRRYLEYHLGRELSNHVGVNRRFAGPSEHNDFLQQLDDHCRVTTGVVRQFAGEWYSKHKWQQDITLRKTRGFAAHAMDKVRDAFRYREARDAH